MAAICVVMGGFTTELSGAEEGSLTVLRTGAGAPLQTEVVTFNLPSADLASYFEFSFGFSTDEEVIPNSLLDSWTATLRTDDGVWTLIYFTADANGVQWAPVTPGTYTLDPDSISRQETTFANLLPEHTHRVAYNIAAPIPEEFAGREVTLYFDLFDNGNELGSLGYFGEVTVVPEPKLFSLALLGFALFGGLLRRYLRT